MTISSVAANGSASWTGVETSFATGIALKTTDQLKAKLTDIGGVDYALTRGTHFSVVIGATGLATIVPIVFPISDGTLMYWRETSLQQDVVFPGADAYDSNAHALAADLSAMRDAELRRDLDAEVARREAEVASLNDAALSVVDNAALASAAATAAATSAAVASSAASAAASSAGSAESWASEAAKYLGQIFEMSIILQILASDEDYGDVGNGTGLTYVDEDYGDVGDGTGLTYVDESYGVYA